MRNMCKTCTAKSDKQLETPYPLLAVYISHTHTHTHLGTRSVCPELTKPSFIIWQDVRTCIRTYIRGGKRG